MPVFVRVEDLVAEDQDPTIKLWGMLLLMAVRDNATSLHYHPWRGEGALAYVVRNVRHEMRPPQPDAAERCIAAARSLMFRGRNRIRRILSGRSSPLCESLTIGIEEHRIEWEVVCWFSRKRSGVDFFRVTPVEQEPAAPSDQLDPCSESQP
jgi:hypothetical protein